MKTWKDIISKETKLIKEFREYFNEGKYHTKSLKFQNIKDIWGYLICFAEMKGYLIEVGKFVGSISKWHNEPEKQYFQHEDFEEGFSGIEQAMLWCASKFFEVADAG